MRELPSILAKPQRLAVGLMSGTSADGVDAALVRLGGSGLETTVETVAFQMIAYEPALRERVLEAGRADTGHLSSLNYELGETFGDAVLAVVGSAGVSIDDVDFVASHGQTVHHDPAGAGGHRSTFQIGEAAVIAERTGCPVVCNFRARDVAAGGTGAPLIPYVDYMLFRDDARSRVLINLGGIVNLTIVPAGARLDDVVAFDVGPCNMILDGLSELLLNTAYDRDGAAAASGRPSRRFVEEVLRHPFYAARPPKSTGRELFGHRFTSSVLSAGRKLGLGANDILASAAMLVGQSIGNALETLVAPRFRHPDEVIVSGGGVHNAAVMGALQATFKSSAVVTSREYGLHPDAKEAIAFAILGNETLEGRPANLPAATGAHHPVVLGAVVPSGRRERANDT